MTTRTRFSVAAPLMLGLFLSACWFGNSPEKLNRQIDQGDATKALNTLEAQLAKYPDDPAINLLTIKARLAVCQQRNCVAENQSVISGTLPPLLAGLPKLATHINGPVTLAKDVSTLSLEQVYTSAMAQYQSLSPQPAAVLAVYGSAPASLQPTLATGLFQPALAKARQGETASASQLLKELSTAENLPNTYTYAATMLSGMFANKSDQRDANLIALRSVSKPPLPANAAALLPWAILAQTKVSGTSPAEALTALPTSIDALQLPNLLNTAALGAVGNELAETAATNARSQWQGGWRGSEKGLQLALQRSALMIDPNQPELWSHYLPALVSATLAQANVSGTQADADLDLATMPLPAARVLSSTAPRIAAQVIHAANRLMNTPPVATPLVTFASKIELGKQQQIDLEKLSQSLLIKAAEQNDVTSTVALAHTLPGVAQNNRQSVVPLLVRYIRSNLREGNFEAATSTAGFLTNTLKMDVEFDPLVLEELTDDLKRRKIQEQLNADTPDVLMQSADEVAVDLGPIFAFMQDYFSKQPKVISGQLTTLIAEATGAYGQPTAMYRLGSYFPEEVLPADKQQDWLAASLSQALLADKRLSGLQLAEDSARLATIHPQLNLAPLLETAIKRAGTLEEQRNLWQSASPQVREVLRAIRPEFTLLMQGVDAISAGQLNAGAQALSNITDATWKSEASPFIEQFNDRLVALSGVYVPVSAAPSLKTASIILAPAGLSGGKLNSVSVTFISRVGTQSESETSSLRTNAAAVHRFSLPIVYNFDSRSLAITPQAVAQAPQGGVFNTTFGSIRTLKLQGENDSSVLNVTLSDGTTTPFVRTLVDTSQPLRPDGTYLLSTRLGTPIAATQNILPPGSMLTLNTADTMQPPAADADTTAKAVYPLTGTLRHPASQQPIQITGFFEPDLFTATFTLNYPLPQSAQPARAAVRCQALAGPITCGAHNLNSARQAYAALITGLQTRESLSSSSGIRAALNGAASTRLLADAVPQIPVVSETIPATATTSSSLTISTSLVSATTISKTTSTSGTTPRLLPPAGVSATEVTEEEESEEEAPAKTSKTSSTEPEPGAFINNSGSKSISDTNPADIGAVPGAFINRSGGQTFTPPATSPTTP